MSRYTTAESIREAKREAELKKDRERKRRARKAKKNAKRQAAVQKRALKNAHKAAVAYNPVSTSALLSGLAVGAMAAAGNHFMAKLFDLNPDHTMRSTVVDLVLDYGIKDVEAALARIKSRIEATHVSFSGGKYTKMR